MKIFVVRHASAVERFVWNGDDSERPLDEEGSNQSLMVSKYFSNINISSIFCSPAVRCQQTIWPTAQKSGTKIELSNSLSEGSISQTSDLVEKLAQTKNSDTSSILCSHGDVISELIRSLTLNGMNIPKRKGFAKASIWELVFLNGKIDSGFYHESHLSEPSKKSF